MSCGLKKQNKPEGGLHLTERTCSPYNPIIKLIVDDCLGLPVYPVTSIDAVIDEDGNTLRKLLDDLIDLIKNGTFDIPELKEKIEYIESIINSLSLIYVSKTGLTTIINGLDDTYATDADLAALSGIVNELKALLWAISALSNINDRHNEDNLFIADDETPTIVDYVKQLRTDLDNITDGGDGLSLQGLQNAINALRELLLAVANFDTGTHNEEGIEHYPNDSKIKIIKEIIDIKAALGMDPDHPGEGDLISRVETLEEKVAALEEESKTHAHLDSKVLAQTPLGTLSAKQKEIYKTLKASELPPTTVDFVRTGITRREEERLEYYGLANVGSVPVDSTNWTADVYPIGHTGLAGSKLFYRPSESDEFIEVRSSIGTPLRAGNGVIDLLDVSATVGLILEDVEFETPAYVNESPIDLAEGNLYIQSPYDNSVYVLLGSVNGDSEVTIGDVNLIINIVLSGNLPTYLLPSNYSDDGKCGWLAYYDSNDRFKAIYPCIEGKLYIDYFTGYTYRYSNNKMYRVNFIEFEEDGNVLIEQSFVDSETSNGEPHMKVTIKVPLFPEIPEPEIPEPIEYEGLSEDPLFELTVEDSGGNTISESEQSQQDNTKVIKLSKENNIVSDNPTDLRIVEPSTFNPLLDYGSYYVKTTPKIILLAYGGLDRGDVGDPLSNAAYTISNVTGAIDMLLNSPAPMVRAMSHNLLKSYIQDKKTSLNWPTDKYNLLTTIEDYLNGYNVVIGSYTIPAQNEPIDYWYIDADDTNQITAAIIKKGTARGGNAEIVRSLLRQWRNSSNELKPLTIEAVTHIIDGLLSNTSDMWYTEPVQLDATLWLVSERGPFNANTIPSEDNSNELDEESEKGELVGKVFRIATTDDNTEDWYYYDRHLDFIPLIPKYTLGLEKEDLCLYRNNDVVSRISFGEVNDGNENGDPQEVQKESRNIHVTYPVFLGEPVEPQLIQDDDPNEEPQWLEIDVSEFKTIKNWASNVYQDVVLSNAATIGSLDTSFVLFRDAVDDLSPTPNISPIAEFIDSAFLSDYIISEMAKFGITPDMNNVLDVLESLDGQILSFIYVCIELSLKKLYTVEHIIKFNDESVTGILIDSNTESGYRLEFDPDKIEYIVLIIDEEPLLENVIYNLDNLGVTLKFKIESNECIPIIVSVDKRLGSSERFTSTTIENQGKVTTAKIYPSEYLQIVPPIAQSLESNTIKFDLTHLVHIPGYEVIEVKGTFIGRSDLDFEFVTGTGYNITQSASNPLIEDLLLYEYTFFNNRFSFKEI